jgi:GNAT superfamily N-acetyltransferase
MKYVKVKIRRATISDLPDIYRIEKRSYTPQLQASHEVIAYRLNTFGIWIAEAKGVVRGFFTCIPAYLSCPSPDIRKILSNRKPAYLPWFKLFEKGGKFNTLFVTSTAVESSYQGMGIGTAMVKYSLSLAKKLGYSYRASALRCEYGKYYAQTGKSLGEYIKEVEQGRINDRFLGLYLKLGFKLGPALPNYEPYKGSMNFNVFAYKKLLE